MKRDWAKSFTNIILSPLPKSQVQVLMAVKDPVIKYSESAFSNSSVNYYWSIKKSSEVIEKLRLRFFLGSLLCSNLAFFSNKK